MCRRADTNRNQLHCALTRRPEPKLIKCKQIAPVITIVGSYTSSQVWVKAASASGTHRIGGRERRLHRDRRYPQANRCIGFLERDVYEPNTCRTGDSPGANGLFGAGQFSERGRYRSKSDSWAFQRRPRLPGESGPPDFPFSRRQDVYDNMRTVGITLAKLIDLRHVATFGFLAV